MPDTERRAEIARSCALVLDAEAFQIIIASASDLLYISKLHSSLRQIFNGQNADGQRTRTF
jgi:hypothetical protein